MSGLAFSPRYAVMTVFVILAAIIVIKSIAPTTATTPAPPSGDSVRSPGNLQGQLEALPQLQEVATPNPSATWVDVFQFTGSDNAQSTMFELTGSLTRLRYTIEGAGETPFLAVYVMAEGPGGTSMFLLPDVIAAGVGVGEKLVARPAGRYYLNVQSLGSAWTIEVAEERVG